MAIDLRTYIALERAFVRRLQRSWQKQSAPIYAAITQACLDHKWDEARRLVGDLDMTEVGTENREWITYMLLSCAVFGANIVSRGTPSFVGVGTFDTFLKQTTNNMLQYLEYGGTRQVQAEALQSIAEDEVKTKALKFDPAQPRDEHGQWTDGLGTLPTTLAPQTVARLKERLAKGTVVYRGVKEAGRTPTDPGDFGVGTYHSSSASRAQQYGNLTTVKLTLQHPLVLTATEAYDQLTNVRDTVTAPMEQRKANAAWLTRALQARGYDGLAIVNTTSKFGEIEFVKFPEPEGWHQGRYQRAGGDELVTVARGVPVPEMKTLRPYDHVFMGPEGEAQARHWEAHVFTTQVPARELIPGDEHVQGESPWPVKTGQARWVPKGHDPSRATFSWSGTPYGEVFKFDAAQHPRGEDGRFIEATAPRIFNRPSDIGELKGWPGDPVRYGWKDKETGVVTGHLLTGLPIAPEDMQASLYHVTTNAPAVESSGVLLGMLEDGGLGGGQAPGVSFTSSKEDAVVIQRELRRAVRIARGEQNEKAFNVYARQDEEEARLPVGSLQYAADQAMQSWDANQKSLLKKYVKELGYVDEPPEPAEYERIRRSLMKDAFNSYLWAREEAAAKANAGRPVSLLKNPILFGRQEHLAKIKPEDVQILDVGSVQIPEGALVTTGSDTFLHEVRAYADVPLWRAKKFDESQHPRHPGGTTEGGRFAETGRAGDIASDPVLAEQAKTGITAVEKLIPAALAGITRDMTWDSMTNSAHAVIYRKWTETTLATHPEMSDDDVSYEWDELSADEKEEITRDYITNKKLDPAGLDALKKKEPETWVTGMTSGTKAEEDYARTGALAKQLTILRMDELMQERGLTQPKREPPEFKIVPAPDHTAETPHFFVQDTNGVTVAAANTFELAGWKAKNWVRDVLEQGRSVYESSASKIESIWLSWVHSSSEPVSLALHLAAAQELGGHHRLSEEEEEEAKNAAQMYGGMPVMQAYVRAQWEVTQLVMAKAKEDRAQVYRGLMLAGERVQSTTHEVLDKDGHVVSPPSNIKVIENRVAPELDTPDKPPLSTVVQFTYAGEKFAVTKEVYKKRLELASGKPVHSILDLPGPGSLRMETTEEAIARRVEKYHYDLFSGGYGAVYGVKPLLVKLPDLNLQRAGAQSTTGTVAVANSWQGVGELPPDPKRVVLRMETPPTSVLSLPVYGKNTQTEHEVVILGTKDKWLWDAWFAMAPTFKEQPISSTTRKADTTTLVIDLHAEDRGKPHWLIGLQSVAKFDPAQPREPAGTEHGGEFASKVKILQGVDFKANAKREIKRHEDRWLKHHGGRQSIEDIRDAAKDAEVELRELPLVHGTTVYGAVEAATNGLQSHADMADQHAELVSDMEDLKDEMVNLTGNEKLDWEEVYNWTEDDVKNLGLERSDEKVLIEKVAELRDVQTVLEGHTFAADEELGLDQLVFMTHGAKHPDYGNVAVIIDNKLVKEGWATEKDIVSMPNAQIGNQIAVGENESAVQWTHYNPEAVEDYRQSLVKGEDYYKVAAAKGDFIPNRERSQLFEVKVPQVPKGAVKGFMVQDDFEAAQRLAEKLGQRGIHNKVFYIDQADDFESRQFIIDQLKTMQSMGFWDKGAVEDYREKHDGVGVYIL